MKSILFLLPLAALFYSCSQSPDCNDEKVKSLTMKIVLTKLKYEIAYTQYYNDRFAKIENSGMGMQMLNDFASIGYESGYAILEKNKKKAKEEIRGIVKGEIAPIEKYDKYIKTADSVVSNSTFFINNVRISEINNETKSCDCLADVSELIDNETEKIVSIDYKVQYSVDGVLNVTVHFNDFE